MTHRTVREWDYLPIDSAGPGAFDRLLANRILSVARTTSLGGDDGRRILSDHHVKLRAQQVVGMIAARGCAVEILPKIDGLDEGGLRQRLVLMLAVALDLPIAAGQLTAISLQRETLLEIIIRLFADRLFNEVHRGLPPRYIDCDDDLPALRGRLDIMRQFTTLAASPQKLACRYDTLSPDTPLNRIMKAAVRRLAGVAQSPETQRRLRELSFAFADVADIARTLLAWDQVTLDRTNSRWRSLLDLARLLLAERFQTTSSGNAEGFSLLFEMNVLFESYVTKVLSKALVGTGLTVHAQGGRLHCLTELDGSGRRRFQTRPDILLKRGEVTAMVIDTKWKRLSPCIEDPKQGVAQADVYQMMAYGRLYRCPDLMLLYPHHTDLGRAEGIVGLHQITGCSDRLAIATINIGVSGSLGTRLKQLVGTMVLMDEPV